jgi:hypothetical protein
MTLCRHSGWRRAGACACACAGLLIVAAGCRSQSTADIAKAAGPVQGHEHVAPHGGTLIEIGQEFAHLECVFEPASARVTMFVLDGEAERPVRLADASIAIVLDAPPALASRPIELAAVADVLTGETVGDTSQFRVTRRELAQLLELRGVVVGLRVKGQSFPQVPFQVPAHAARQDGRSRHAPAVHSLALVGHSRESRGHESARAGTFRTVDESLQMRETRWT